MCRIPCSVINERATLMAEFSPDVPLRELSGNQSLLSSELARRLIGYHPQFGWRDRIDS
jgi:hypothetical protein